MFPGHSSRGSRHPCRGPRWTAARCPTATPPPNRSGVRPQLPTSTFFFLRERFTLYSDAIRPMSCWSLGTGWVCLVSRVPELRHYCGPFSLFFPALAGVVLLFNGGFPGCIPIVYNGLPVICTLKPQLPCMTHPTLAWALSTSEGIASASTADLLKMGAASFGVVSAMSGRFILLLFFFWLFFSPSLFLFFGGRMGGFLLFFPGFRHLSLTCGRVGYRAPPCPI